MSKKKRRRVSPLRQKFPINNQKKLVVLFAAIVLAFIGLIGMITYINATSGEKYTKIVLDQQYYSSRTIPYKRGDIVDRNGTPIATSERVYKLIFDAKLIAKETNKSIQKDAKKQVKEVLERVFEIEGSVVDDKLKNSPNSQYCVLQTGISYYTAQEFKKVIAETHKNKDGKTVQKYPYVSALWLEEGYVREYPYQTLASQLIGFVSGEGNGSFGIEASYDSILKGTNGRAFGYQDTDATLERTVKAAIDGKTVVSTIDVSLQSIVEKHILAFNEEHKNEDRTGEGSLNTAVIIMNPNTGEILAEASYPNFDLNNPGDLTKYYTQETIDGMTAEEKQVIQNTLWKNFCVSDVYEPGSTAKPFTVAAGLENGTLKGNEWYTCNGALVVGGWTIGCHKREGHGPQSLADGIANSCNVAMMRIAESIKKEEYRKYLKNFSFGQKTGIDLPNEGIGVLYDAENMDAATLATNSFGQNFEVTMTQMVAGFASLINGGNYYQPHVVKQILDSNGNVIENKAPVLLKKTISAETCEFLKKAMKQTMTDGTGKNAQVPGYSIGAKTGTAEKAGRDDKSYLLSYMGFAPAENPEVLIYVVIDEPNVAKQDTSKLVTDLARNIMAEAFPYLDITREEASTDVTTQGKTE